MESSNWKTKIVVGDVVKILLYYASRKVSEYIYTSENDAEQEARECTSHFCEILTKKGVLVSNIEKVGMFAEIATAFQAHQSATPSVTNVDDENDDEDDEDENNETTDENQSVIVEKKDNPRIIGQSFTTANLVQEILDNDSCFSCYEIDLCVERVRRGAKKLVPGEDRVPKNIMVSDYSGDKYRAKISSIEILRCAFFRKPMMTQGKYSFTSLRITSWWMTVFLMSYIKRVKWISGCFPPCRLKICCYRHCNTTIVSITI